MATRTPRPRSVIGSCIALSASLAVVAGCAGTSSTSHPLGPPSGGTSTAQTQVCPGQRVDTDAALRDLSGCTEIAGDLIVRRTNVSSLRRLSRLTSVRGRLEVSDNAHLRSLAGLENLSRVRELVVTRNPNLVRVSALARLSSVASITLEDLPALESTVGLERLQALDALSVCRTGLSTLRGLEGLRLVRRLQLEKNWNLVSVRQLSGIARADVIEIRDNPLLYGGPEEFFPRLRGVHEIVMTDNGAISPREAESFAGRVAMSQPPAADHEGRR